MFVLSTSDTIRAYVNTVNVIKKVLNLNYTEMHGDGYLNVSSFLESILYICFVFCVCEIMTIIRFDDLCEPLFARRVLSKTVILIKLNINKVGYFAEEIYV